MKEYYDEILVDCWDKALQGYGTSYVYLKRIARLKRQIALSKATGIALPVLLGGMVSTYFQYQEVMAIAIAITSPIAVLQLVFSTILTVNGAEEKLVKFIELSTKNTYLSDNFKSLAKYPPKDFKELRARYDVLVERERNISDSDYDISDKESRMGMRYGLREFQRKCAGCKQVPISMNSTNCDVCGNF